MDIDDIGVTQLGWSRMVIQDMAGVGTQIGHPGFHTQGHEIPGSQLDDPDRDIPIMTKRTTLANPRLNSS
jgi:hypothetical protein